MDILNELEIVLKLFLAFILGGAIGFDRERDGGSRISWLRILPTAINFACTIFMNHKFRNLSP